MDQEKALTLHPSSWCASHNSLFARALVCDPLVSPETLRENVANGRAMLFDVIDSEGEILGAVVLRVEKRELGAEGVIDAGAGRLPFTRSQFPALIRAIEKKFYGVKFIRIETASRSIMRAFARLGYKPRQVTICREVSV